jgi:hypothetical protein
MRMKVRDLVDSQTFFEISKHVLHEERAGFVKTFLEILAALPVAAIYKLWLTGCKLAGVLTSGIFLLITLGLSQGLRDLFVKQVASFAANLADWVLYPFAIATCISRFLLAMVIHPSLFFRY